MPEMKIYDVEVTYIRKNVAAESSAEALRFVQSDIRTSKDVHLKEAIVARQDL